MFDCLDHDLFIAKLFLLLSDLSKVFDCLDHDLFIAKLFLLLSDLSKVFDCLDHDLFIAKLFLLLSDLSKVFDCLDHDLFIAKLFLLLSDLSKVFDCLDHDLFIPRLFLLLSDLSKVFDCLDHDLFIAKLFLLLSDLSKVFDCLDHDLFIANLFLLLSDLSKVFDCLDHDLFIAKLNIYGFDIIQSLTNRFQRVRINSKYSKWSEIIIGVPQGSILGTLLFNIYLSDLFLFTENSEIANYADDNSPYACCEKDMEEVTRQQDLFKTGVQQYVKANPDKFHLLVNGNNINININISVNVNGYEIVNCHQEKLLGVTIDNKLSFTLHVPISQSKTTCSSQKIALHEH